MSDEDQARAEEGPVQQEVVVGTENDIGKESGLVDAQKQVDFACWSLDVLELDPAEERGDSGQVNGRKISGDVGDAKGNDIHDLPGGRPQRNLIGEGLPLLGQLSSHL